MDSSNSKSMRLKHNLLNLKKKKMKEKSRNFFKWSNILGTDKTARVLLDPIPKNVLKQHEEKLKISSNNARKKQLLKAAKRKPLLKDLINSSLVMCSLKAKIQNKKKRNRKNMRRERDGLLQWQVLEVNENGNKPSMQDLNMISKKKRKVAHRSCSPKKSKSSKSSNNPITVECKYPKVVLTNIFQNIEEDNNGRESPINISLLWTRKSDSCEVIEPKKINFVLDRNDKSKQGESEQEEDDEPEEVSLDLTEDSSNDDVEVIENDTKEAEEPANTKDKEDLVILDDHVESFQNSPLRGANTSDTYEYYIIGTTCFFILRHPYKLYFHGKLRVSCIFGKVEILGHILDTNTDVVFSFSQNSLLCFETLENTASIQSKHVLSDYGLNEDLIQSLKDSDCILKLHRHDSIAVSFINEHMDNILDVDYNKNIEIEELLKCRFYQNNCEKPLYEKNHAWDQIIDNISLSTIDYKRNVILLSGGKNVGKSTLMRYLSNKVFPKTESVLCIDLDPGQSEFTIGGCISATLVSLPLLGPTYTHLQNPVKSIFLGTVNVSECVTRYFKAISCLIEFCNKEDRFKKIPWIINTMGFTRGMGLDIIAITIGLAKPTQVVQIISSNVKQNYPQILRPQYVEEVFSKSSLFQMEMPNLNYDIIVLDAIVTTNANITQNAQNKNLRQFNVFSYFSQLLKQEGDTLNAINPYKVKKSAVNILSLCSKVEDQYLLAMINANMVALCSKGDNKEFDEFYIVHGFGIVRGIDEEDIYIITPLKPADLDLVKYLVLSSEKLPESLYLKNVDPEVTIPYFSSFQTSRTTTIPKRSFFNYKSVLQTLIK